LISLRGNIALLAFLCGKSTICVYFAGKALLFSFLKPNVLSASAGQLISLAALSSTPFTREVQQVKPVLQSFTHLIKTKKVLPPGFQKRNPDRKYSTA
jgi:hypothetical protein